MTTEKFVKKLFIKIIILVIISVAIIAFLNSSSTIINNHIALEQLENSDEWFVIMEMYNNFLKPTCSVSLILIITYIIITIIWDIIKFIKNKNYKIYTKETLE